MKLPELERLERQKAVIKSQKATPDQSSVRQCFGVRVKEWNKTSKLYSLCSECIKTIDPPTQCKNKCASAVCRCD